LAAVQTFQLFTDYLSNVVSSFKYWCKIYVERHCKARKDNGDTNVYNLAELNLNAIIGKIVNAIKHLLMQYSNENSDIK